MINSNTTFGLLLIIVIMAVVTLITRWGGVYAMSYVPLRPKVQRFISGMSSAVLVAILAPLAVNGDLGAQVALAVTALVVITVKRPMVAILAGVVAAALCRHFMA